MRTGQTLKKRVSSRFKVDSTIAHFIPAYKWLKGNWTQFSFCAVSPLGSLTLPSFPHRLPWNAIFRSPITWVRMVWYLVCAPNDKSACSCSLGELCSQVPRCCSFIANNSFKIAMAILKHKSNWSRYTPIMYWLVHRGQKIARGFSHGLSWFYSTDRTTNLAETFLLSDCAKTRRPE